jgi:hypothetical protein
MSYWNFTDFVALRNGVCATKIWPQPKDRSYTAQGAVGRKTRRAQDSVYSLRLLRVGFEPLRAYANPTRFYRCANR